MIAEAGTATGENADSALVVLVPQVAELLQAFRARYTPGVPLDMPAHITLIFPFKSPTAIDAEVLASLRHCFAAMQRFDFALSRLEIFPADAVYLAPEPAEPFRRLTLAIWRRYPDQPPYGGRYPRIVPHLTLARIPDAARLSSVADDFATAFPGSLPIAGRADAVALMDNSSGRWEVRTTFGLM